MSFVFFQGKNNDKLYLKYLMYLGVARHFLLIAKELTDKGFLCAGSQSTGPLVRSADSS